MNEKMQELEQDKDSLIIRLQDDVAHLSNIIGSLESKLQD